VCRQNGQPRASDGAIGAPGTTGASQRGHASVPVASRRVRVTRRSSSVPDIRPTGSGRSLAFSPPNVRKEGAGFDLPMALGILGAMGVVLKEHAPDVLIKAIEKVHAGEIWLDRPTMGRMLREMTGKDEKEIDPELTKIESLTQREREVVALIAEGLKNRQIGERLFISETTVTHHLSSIYSKLGVSDRLELVIYAFTHKIKPGNDR